jgi:hypothetical protein
MCNDRRRLKHRAQLEPMSALSLERFPHEGNYSILRRFYVKAIIYNAWLNLSRVIGSNTRIEMLTKEATGEIEACGRSRRISKTG